jgi:undecaprenyl-diphosphatase
MLQSADASLVGLLVPWHTPRLDTVMAVISAAGSGGAFWIALGIVGLAVPKWRAGAWRLLLAIGLTLLINNVVLKPIIARPRPAIAATAAERNLPATPSTYSFPSGHVAVSGAAAITLSRLWPAGRLAWWALAALTAYSRLYLGHHYPLDLVGGAVVGILVALWVLGGRHPATDARTLPRALPAGTILRP